MSTWPPEAVGKAAGLPVPARLPDIGTKVVDVDGREGVVALYQFYDPDQTWFPVTFARLQCAVTQRCKLGENANRQGCVQLAAARIVTPLRTARKPPPGGTASDVAAHAAAS